MAKLKVSILLKESVGNKRDIEIKNNTLFDILKECTQINPNFLSKVCDSNGNIYPYINIFINNIEVRKLRSIYTKICEEDEIYILPAVR